MDQYLQQLYQQELSQSVASENIKAQYALYSKQAATASSGNAVANLGIILTSAPKATSAVSALYNVAKTPGIIKDGINNLTTGGMQATELRNAGQRVMGLVKDLRTNPDLKVSLQNYTANSQNTGQQAMGNFNLDYNRITGKSVEFQNPEEISMASKLDRVVGNYDNFIRTNRGLAGVDAEAETDKMVARLGDMVDARATDVATGRAGIGIDDGFFGGIGNRISAGLDRLGTAIGEGASRVGTAIGEGASRFSNSVGDFASSVYNNLRGYANLDNEPALQNVSSLQRLMTSGRNEYGENANLLESEYEPVFTDINTAFRPSQAVSRLPAGVRSVSMPQSTSTTGTTGTTTEVEAPQPVASSTTSSTAPISTTSTEESVAPIQATRATTTTPAAPATAGEAGTEAGAGAEATQATAPTEIATTTATTAGEAGEVAGAAGAGVLSGAGDFLSLLAGPVGAIVGLAGLGYSIYQAVEGSKETPPESGGPQTAQPSFNPITSAMPASTLHF